LAVTPTGEREAAIAAADASCPRCGAARTPEQEYCVECGMRLPIVRGAVPALRRRWVRRLGWYPGDWVWLSLVLLAVAAAGATVSILVTRHEDAQAGETIVATPAVSNVREPTTAPVTTANTATLPTPPEPTTPVRSARLPPAAPNGRTPWPADRRTGWTVVLVSYPAGSGRPQALATATRAAKAGLPEVGILDSGHFASLHPGYFVVFSGIYGSQGRADAALRTARASGFAGAYSRQITR
jgi:hypothetical protein